MPFLFFDPIHDWVLNDSKHCLLCEKYKSKYITNTSHEQILYNLVGPYLIKYLFRYQGLGTLPGIILRWK